MGAELTTPAPGRVLEHRRRHHGANEGVDDERRRGERGDETTPFERGDVGDDDLREQL